MSSLGLDRVGDAVAVAREVEDSVVGAAVVQNLPEGRESEVRGEESSKGRGVGGNTAMCC